MKTSFRAIILVLAIVGLTTLIFLLKKDRYFMEAKSNNRLLKVAFPSARTSSSYEPTNISLDYEYIFLENIFSPLVEVDAHGEIQPGVAEKVDLIGDEYRFQIREGLKTSSGIIITPDDVLFSLKRVLVLSGNTHGNFKALVCSGIELKSVDENCPGMRKEGNYVFLKAFERKSFLLPMLTAIDFAIIPRTSTDPHTLAITNMKDTSGPYYVARDGGDGNIELRLNSSHYHAANNIPAIVKFVPTNSKVQGDSLKALVDGRVDHLTTIDASRAEEVLAFAHNNSGFNSHTTMKIRSLILVFTTRGRRELSTGERKFIAEKMRRIFAKIYSSAPGFEQRGELFPSLGDGGLSEAEEKELAAIRIEGLQAPLHSFRLGLMKRGSLEPWTTPIKAELPQADCYLETNAPDLKRDLKPEEEPHAFITSTDTGGVEDISLISYSLNAGLLGLSKPERASWLEKYMALDDKALRIEALRKLHFNALAEPALVPLVASPYAALVRKPWRMELSQLYANNQLWLIKAD